MFLNVGLNGEVQQVLGNFNVKSLEQLKQGKVIVETDDQVLFLARILVSLHRIQHLHHWTFENGTMTYLWDQRRA